MRLKREGIPKQEGTGKQDINMKKLFRRNQIIITTLAIMIAAAGYLNYAGKRELEASAGDGIYQAGTGRQCHHRGGAAPGGRIRTSGRGIAGGKPSGRIRCGNGAGRD